MDGNVKFFIKLALTLQERLAKIYNKTVAKVTFCPHLPRLMMNTQEQARQLMVKDRLHEEHLHETLTSRAAETELVKAEEVTEQARERLVQERLHQEHLQETMAHRALDSDT
jgi:hypothetical protein